MKRRAGELQLGEGHSANKLARFDPHQYIRPHLVKHSPTTSMPNYYGVTGGGASSLSATSPSVAALLSSPSMSSSLGPVSSSSTTFTGESRHVADEHGEQLTANKNRFRQHQQQRRLREAPDSREDRIGDEYVMLFLL